MADACVFLMSHYDGDTPINIGTGEEVSIRELATIVRDVVYPDATGSIPTACIPTAVRAKC